MPSDPRLRVAKAQLAKGHRSLPPARRSCPQWMPPGWGPVDPAVDRAPAGAGRARDVGASWLLARARRLSAGVRWPRSFARILRAAATVASGACAVFN